jgi:hypothetical protein
MHLANSERPEILKSVCPFLLEVPGFFFGGDFIPRLMLLNLDKPLLAQQICRRSQNRRVAGRELPQTPLSSRCPSPSARKAPHCLREQSAGNRIRHAETVLATAYRNGVFHS